jgi:F-type H+-transporting ATPase subunit a
MSVILASDFSWFSLVPGLGHSESGPNLVPFIHSMLVVTVLLVGALIARMTLLEKLRSGDRRDALVPDADLRPRNLFELVIEFVYGLCKQELGKDAQRFFPLIGTIFLYILLCNLLGLVPGFVPATSNINTNIGMALCVFLVYNLSGLMRHGVGYIKHFMGPVLWLAPLMFVIEVVGAVARPVSLSVRLYGNMFGDHTVLSIFMHELPAQTSPLLAYGIPVIFLGLGTFVCVVQAFVFSLLSIIYISLAVKHEEH